jgi:hypothetical protein
MDYCAQYPQLARYVNVCDYSIPELALVLAGTLFWIAAYYIIIRNAFRNKYVEMPVVAGAANVAWEFTWGFLLTTDLGLVFVWGLRIWFLMDLLILYSLLKWGVRQYRDKLFIGNFRTITLLQVLIWVPTYIYFYRGGYDTAMGATSAYVICVLMAVLYVTSFAGTSYKNYYSPRVAWFKWLGNTPMMVYVFLQYPQMYFLQIMAAVVFVFDVWYIALVMRHRMNPRASNQG